MIPKTCHALCLTLLIPPLPLLLPHQTIALQRRQTGETTARPTFPAEVVSVSSSVVLNATISFLPASPANHTGGVSDYFYRLEPKEMQQSLPRAAEELCMLSCLAFLPLSTPPSLFFFFPGLHHKNDG